MEGRAEALLIAVTRRSTPRMRGGAECAALRASSRGELGNFPELAQFYFHEVILRARRLVEQVLARGVATL